MSADAWWSRRARTFIQDGERWLFRGKLAYRQPVGRVLTGVTYEGSSWGLGVYVFRVTMPLFYPEKFLALSWSHRYKPVRPEDGFFEATFEAAFARFPSEEELLAGFVVKGMREPRAPGLQEVTAYSQILLGDLDQAHVSLGLAAADGDDKRPFVEEKRERARLITRLLDEGGRDAAIAQLDEWVEYTSTALKLDRGTLERAAVPRNRDA